MFNALSFLKLTACLLLVNLCFVLSVQAFEGSLEGDNQVSEEVGPGKKPLFPICLGHEGVDFDKVGKETKDLSVIGMFSDEKLSGEQLDVMHWVHFTSPESQG